MVARVKGSSSEANEEEVQEEVKMEVKQRLAEFSAEAHGQISVVSCSPAAAVSAR